MIYFFQFKYVGKGVGISWEITARYLENKKRNTSPYYEG